MKNTETRNEIVKRLFFRHLTEAKGLCPSTVEDIEKAILQYQTFSNNADFNKFSPDKAIQFKQWLRNRGPKDKPLAIASQHTYLRHTERFFAWLSQQPGYKSKFTFADTEYLHMTKKDRRVAGQSALRQFPSLEHILKLTGSIQITSEIDQRDRALIALTTMTGIRDTALATLPFNSFNEHDLTISQNPRNGVETKFSKNITTAILNFDNKLMEYFLAWVQTLKTKNWNAAAPLFPRSKLEQGEESILFAISTTVIPEFWSGADCVRAIFKKRAKTAGMPYYPPHCFKHFAIAHALLYCKSGEEIKALSQNFGHEHVATTFAAYGTQPDNTFINTLRKIDFSGTPQKSTDDKINELTNIMETIAKTVLTSKH